MVAIRDGIMTGPTVGLTWDHPRGYNALSAAAPMVAEAAGRPGLVWERQPLEGFESAPIGELAARYDLLVLDHPHIGEAVALDCLRPLESIFSTEQLVDWRRNTVGAAMTSYLWQNHQWALPLDIATQVTARRPDLVESTPDNWDDVVRLAERGGVALSLAGPHAVLNLYAVAACYGYAPGGQDLLEDVPFAEALSLLKRLHTHVPPGSDRSNPIGLLERMQQGDDIVLVPLIYGYVNYAASSIVSRRLAFSDAPRLAGGLYRGSVLGGTGIAFSARREPDPAVVDHIAWLMSAEAQERFIPDHAGQPSRRSAYVDERLNAEWGGFYTGTIRTSQTALLRPRHDGYIAFQTQAAQMVREFLSGDGDIAQTMAAIRQAWRNNLALARGPVEQQQRAVDRIQP